MKILCLFVRHGTQQHPEALAHLDAWYERQGLRQQRTLWIIDNALAPRPPQRLSADTVLRAGDNTAWEFSAWARAIREAKEEGLDHDVVHFVTSAFNSLYTAYLDHFHPDMLGYVLSRSVALGHIDSYDRPVQLEGRSSASWIRTCFFFLPMKLAGRINPWVGFTDPTRFFTSPDSTQFRPDAPISADYQHRIRIWLEGKEVGGHTWHSPIRTDPGETARFQRKTLAITNEHHLALTLRELPANLVDFCWLHTVRAGREGLDLPAPTEEAQLVVRRRFLGIPEAG